MLVGHLVVAAGDEISVEIGIVAAMGSVEGPPG